MIKAIIKNLLKQRGLAITPYDEYSVRLEQVENDWLKKKSIKTILDVGAGAGQYAKKAKKIFSGVEMFSFEALPEQFQKLKEVHKESAQNHHFFNIVLSDQEEEITFYKSSSMGSSSLFNMSDTHKEAYPQTADITSLTLKAVRLDDVLKEYQLKRNILLKLDVQGAEMKVLQGAVHTLSQVSMIFIELSFIKLYEGQPLINDMIEYLKGHGFILSGIENVSRDLRDGSYLQCDAYFERKA